MRGDIYPSKIFFASLSAANKIDSNPDWENVNNGNNSKIYLNFNSTEFKLFNQPNLIIRFLKLNYFFPFPLPLEEFRPVRSYLIRKTVYRGCTM